MSNQQLSFIDLNIEQDKHLDRVIPFLEKNQFDIICLQELFEEDFLTIKEKLKINGIFSPRVKHRRREGRDGIAIFSRYPIKHTDTFPYDQFTEPIKELDHMLEERPKGGLLYVAVEAFDQLFHFGTVHFTWAGGGEVSDEQRANIPHLISSIKNLPELVLAGDFNCPRGKEIYDTLAATLKDNIPGSVTSTIDPNLHRAGKLEYVVDGLFSTPEYNVQNVIVQDGLSDHCAIIAQIQKR